MLPPRLTRRAFLRATALSATALGGTGLLLSACTPQASPSSSGSSPRAPTGAPSFAPSPAPPSAAPGPPLRQRIARLLVVGFRGLAVAPDDWIGRAIAEEGIGGVILFDKDAKRGASRNVASPDQVRELVAGLASLAPDRELIVAIDQEGGKVTRLSPAHGFPAVASQAAIGPDGDDAVRAWADGLATTLAEVGVNLNLAPVVDLNLNPTNPSIGALKRAFSADPTLVARDAEIEIVAHRERGVRTALKHFPGLGSATSNTDFGVADVTDSWRDVELDPYRRLVGLGIVDAVMVANLVNGQIDPSAPASLSRATVTGLLREQLGWDGVVVTDDLQAGAITDAFGFEDAVALALEAGNDLLLFANQQVYDDGVVTRVVDLVEQAIVEGRLTEGRIDESLARLEQLFPSSD